MKTNVYMNLNFLWKVYMKKPLLKSKIKIFFEKWLKRWTNFLTYAYLESLNN